MFILNATLALDKHRRMYIYITYSCLRRTVVTSTYSSSSAWRMAFANWHLDITVYGPLIATS